MMVSGPWRHWYHLMGNTYGTWLPGDSRGFRTRHHREHVDGDYKNPPAHGRYTDVLENSRRRLKDNAVIFGTRALRNLVCRSMVEALQHHNVELVDLCVSTMHFHFLARFGAGGTKNLFTGTPKPPEPPDIGELRGRDVTPRYVVGRVKSWTTRKVKASGRMPELAGTLWARRCMVLPVRDRQHQLNVARYIRDHGESNAAVG